MCCTRLRDERRRGFRKTLAQKRLFFTGSPQWEGESPGARSAHAQRRDLLPVEMPWSGPSFTLMLFETPYRQLVPFSRSTRASATRTCSSWPKAWRQDLHGATLPAHDARANPQISIIERGDSYQPLVELMGGRVIDVKLDGAETLNPWDLPKGETTPSKEKIALLKISPAT